MTKIQTFSKSDSAPFAEKTKTQNDAVAAVQLVPQLGTPKLAQNVQILSDFWLCTARTACTVSSTTWCDNDL